jgi:hypothetical protein
MSVPRLPPWRRLISTLLLACTLAFAGDVPGIDLDYCASCGFEAAHADYVLGYSQLMTNQPGESSRDSQEQGFGVCQCTHTPLICVAARETGQNASPRANSDSIAYCMTPRLETAPVLRPPIT